MRHLSGRLRTTSKMDFSFKKKHRLGNDAILQSLENVFSSELLTPSQSALNKRQSKASS